MWGHVTTFGIFGTPNISGTNKARNFKFGTKMDSKKVSFIISKAIALQLDYKFILRNTHTQKKTTNMMKVAKKHPTKVGRNEKPQEFVDGNSFHGCAKTKFDLKGNAYLR